MSYFFSKKVSVLFDEAVEKVQEELKKEGFGILSQINVKETLKEKIGVNFREYKILGACNPSYAYKALQAERNIGTMLPCNVVVQENEAGGVEVTAVDPVASMQAVDNAALSGIVREVREKLRSVIDRM